MARSNMGGMIIFGGPATPEDEAYEAHAAREREAAESRRADRDRQFRRTMARLGVEVANAFVDVGFEGAFTIGFRNYYFTVDGPCPLTIAEALYATPVGRTDIRAMGDCACPEPKTRATYFDADGVELVNDPDGRQAREWDGAIASGNGLGKVLSTLPRPRFVPDAAAMAARAVVKAFHVDSELGLYMLLQALRAEVKP